MERQLVSDMALESRSLGSQLAPEQAKEHQGSQ